MFPLKGDYSFMAAPLLLLLPETSSSSCGTDGEVGSREFPSAQATTLRVLRRHVRKLAETSLQVFSVATGETNKHIFIAALSVAVV